MTTIEVSNFIDLCNKGINSLSAGKIKELVEAGTQVDLQKLFQIVRQNRKFVEAFLLALLNLSSIVWSSHNLEAQPFWAKLSENEKRWLTAKYYSSADSKYNPLTALIVHSSTQQTRATTVK